MNHENYNNLNSQEQYSNNEKTPKNKKILGKTLNLFTKNHKIYDETAHNSNWL